MTGLQIVIYLSIGLLIAIICGLAGFLFAMYLWVSPSQPLPPLVDAVETENAEMRRRFWDGR